ncbi:Coiled-coil domain-containing protein 40 [Bagarius yarrelli]|uniref:Coiled-coil domain-containing protein 40 n=1 Tax=Bagarius yarrelli TaxID=175774 RepID=A0A556VXD6_BAGYA|nr:Coiled-coil domain-containing protein 40 [Bagarius yarrelli]
MERTAAGQDGGWRESLEQEEPDAGTEAPPDISVSQQVAFADRERPAENDDDDDDELIVLDPEHPLMKRFQSAVQQHLNRQLERLDLKLREKVTEEREECCRREQLGVSLYNVQQELARLQASLEAQHESSADAMNARRRMQEQLENIRNQSANQKVSGLDMEAEGYRRSIVQEQEQNEALTVLLNRVRSLNKELEELGAEIKEQHQRWLWQQGELNLNQLLVLQSRVKQLQAVTEGRYSTAASDEEALRLATVTQWKQLQTVRHAVL